MAEQKQEDQLEHIYSSYVGIRDVALKTCQRQEKWRERVRDIRASDDMMMMMIYCNSYFRVNRERQKHIK